MSVFITDCTIRDGGYLLNKNSDPAYIKGIIQGLVDAGIDFVETGFLQNNSAGESLVYHDSTDVIKYLPTDNLNTHYLGFCDNSRYSLENLNTYDERSFKWLRISFAKHEIDASLTFCEGAMKKGYLVQFNPMDTISYTASEREELIKKVNKVLPAAFSIVDTFGAMYIDDLKEIFKQFDELLDKRIIIGLHSHDNLGLSCALAEELITLAAESGRDVSVDGSLFGMGRGAGNARTELLADYLNKKFNKNYNIAALIDTIERYIIPLTDSVKWGYDLPMYVCGTKHAHVDNVYHLRKNYSCSAKQMYEVLGEMTVPQRTRYGSSYSKSDFTILDEAYKQYISK
ncbi:hypothetical protein [Butyrivibrio sp. NC2007]|uniref:hypothetical protein n=1 Tax=Butyrivibrio sp. NC2007 TaxID=1280683 RepID=UPI0003B30750|nr:hypothetical protein [Butyrivibrio sp. NC2007]